MNANKIILAFLTIALMFTSCQFEQESSFEMQHAKLVNEISTSSSFSDAVSSIEAYTIASQKSPEKLSEAQAKLNSSLPSVNLPNEYFELQEIQQRAVIRDALAELRAHPSTQPEISDIYLRDGHIEGCLFLWTICGLLGNEPGYCIRELARCLVGGDQD